MDKPTLTLIEAEGWRQTLGAGGGWGQLANPALATNRNALVFPEGAGKFRRDRSELGPLLGVIRLRSGDETPGYATNRRDWRFDGALPMPNYAHPAAFVDRRPDIFHYLSVNGVATTNAKQPQYTLRGKKSFLYKSEGNEHAFKHAPVIEMVPFCVAEPFDVPGDAGLKALCRVAHYLRVHPGWGLGEVNSPYPLHLGDALIRDQETILGADRPEGAEARNEQRANPRAFSCISDQPERTSNTAIWVGVPRPCGSTSPIPENTTAYPYNSAVRLPHASNCTRVHSNR